MKPKLAQKHRSRNTRILLRLAVFSTAVTLLFLARPLREWKDRADNVTYAGEKSNWRKAFQALADEVRRNPHRRILAVRMGNFWIRNRLFDENQLDLCYNRHTGRLQGYWMNCIGTWEGVTDASFLRAVERLDRFREPHAVVIEGARCTCP